MFLLEFALQRAVCGKSLNRADAAVAVGAAKIAAAVVDFKSNKYRKNERLMVFLVGCWLSQKQIFSLKVSR